MIKQFSSYNIQKSSGISEQDAALEFAKKRNKEHLEKLKKSPEFIESEKIKKTKEKELEDEQYKELKRVLLIPDSVIKENIKKAEENNLKFANSFNQNSDINDLLDSLFE